MPDLVSSRLGFTRDGQRLAAASRDGIAIRGGGTGIDLAIGGVDELVVFGDQLWTRRGAALERWRLDGRTLGEPIELAGTGTLAPTHAGPPAAVWSGRPCRGWLDDLGTLTELALAPDAAILPFAGRRVFTVEDGRREPCVRLGAASWTLPAGTTLVAAAALFDGASVVVLVARGGAVDAWVSTTSGAIRHRVALPPGQTRLAARRGVLAVHVAPDRCELFDLRFGRPAGSAQLPPATDLAIDPDGGCFGILGTDGVDIVSVRDSLRASRSAAVVAPLDASPAPDSPHRPRPQPAPATPRELPAAVAPVLEPLDRPLALATLGPPSRTSEPAAAGATAQLDRELRAILLRALVAIAEGWNDRRIGYANESAHPHEHEVCALVGIGGTFARDHVAAARAELAAHQEVLAADPDRRGPQTALGALAVELGLSPLALDILLVAAAPTVWGEVARLYGIASNDPGRAVVDELLVFQVLAVAGVDRHQLARELDRRAPLLRSGALRAVGGRPRPFSELVVDPVVIARLRGEPPDLGHAVVTRDQTAALEEIVLPRDVLRAALAALAERTADPMRIDVRGRPGSGRRTLLASLAHEAGRRLAVIEAPMLPHAPEAFTSALAAALRRSHLAGMTPCLAGLDQLGFGERSVGDVVREVLRAHPGPLAVISPPNAPSLFDPGHVVIELPPLGETERIAVWERALAARALWVRDLAGLGARYRIGAGTIHRAVAAVTAGGTDASDGVESFVRQTRDRRLSSVAEHIERTATWSSLVLPPDVLDSLRELVARVRYRRQVYETWGMAATMSTSRGITALFQGQPGTGKTLVAGVIARELGLDLYRVDLSKVTSKWIGETERNLAALFDAAEDGQVILLFDEADSLFAKRTEVRSSNDRYANLEVNYLLQRLDTFEGIAILTTNFGGAIDPAFKRRMSFRLSFPFPDEDTREQLWRVHLPPQLPIEGELALDKLAHKYQLAGGYIRNACLRAAFLAAQEERALLQDHLERAVALEFAELGKLSSSGSIE